MTPEYETIDQAIAAIRMCLPEREHKDYDTNDEVADELIDLGRNPKVDTYHDSYLGLKDRLSEDFRRARPNEAGRPEFEKDLAELCEEAEHIIPLYLKNLTPDDQEDIDDDQAYHGHDPDD